MKKFAILLTATLAAANMALAGDLVVNGSFESPDLTIAPGHVDRAIGSWLTVTTDGDGIPPWKVTAAPVSIIRTPYNEGSGTLLSGDHFQSIDLTGGKPDGLGGVEQTVLTIPGRDYVLTFQLGMFPGSAIYRGPIRVQASAGTTTAEFRHDGTAPVLGGSWQDFALPFRATAEATVIRFRNLQAAQWCGLDRVAIAEASAAGSQTDIALGTSTVNGGGGMSTADNQRFCLRGTIGQSIASTAEIGGFHLFAGFWGPSGALQIATRGDFIRVSWDFGLGLNQLETTSTLTNQSGAPAWTPVSLAGDARDVLFPANEGARFFRIREN